MTLVEDARNAQAAFYHLLADSIRHSTIRTHARALQAVDPLLTILYGPKEVNDAYVWSSQHSTLPYYPPGDEYCTLLCTALIQFKRNPVVIQHVLCALSYIVHNSKYRQGGETPEDASSNALSRSNSGDTESWINGAWMGLNGLRLEPVLEVLQQHRNDPRVVQPAFRLLTRAVGGLGVVPHLNAYDAHSRTCPAVILFELFFGAQDVGEGMLLRIAKGHMEQVAEFLKDI